MEPISGMIPRVSHMPSQTENVKEPSKGQPSEDKMKGNPITPARDKYIPEEKQEATGRYWVEKEEGGKLTVRFDDPEQPSEASEKQEALPHTDAPAQGKDADGPVQGKDADGPVQGKDAEGPERDRKADGPEKKDSGRKAERCTVNTDKVDREIEKLKKKKEELEGQISSETDESKLKELERKLAKVESELRQKDNDTYRRQHATFHSF